VKADSNLEPDSIFVKEKDWRPILDAVGHSPGKDLPLDKVFTSPLAVALQTMARQGHGIAWLPHLLAADDIAARRLVSAGNDRFSVPVEISLFRANDRKPALAEAFWQAVSRQSSVE
jgi:LysR family transcriptional regulator, hypochlorite-specific transcription factor HypT